MEFRLNDLKIAQSTFIEKILSDLHFGVKVKSDIAEQTKQEVLIMVWTDNQFWQFSLAGVSPDPKNIVLQHIEIQSFGASKKYIKLTGDYTNLELKLSIDKLSSHFAQLSSVTIEEARDFVAGYMESTINRTLTEQLFAEYAQNKDVKAWVVQ